jgi:hypothetical protein
MSNNQLFMAFLKGESNSLLTGTEADPAGVVTELKTIPQIRSTQARGVPVVTKFVNLYCFWNEILYFSSFDN